MNKMIDEQHDDLDLIENTHDPKKSFISLMLQFFKGIFHSEKKIGEMNGKWAALFRAVLVLLFFTIPTIGTWSIWITRSVWIQQGHMTTTSSFEDRIDTLEKTDVSRAHVSEQLEKINNKINQLPPIPWQERINENTKCGVEIKQQILDLDKTNTQEHNRISSELKESISKLDRDSSIERATIITSLEYIKEQVSKK